MAKAKPFKSFQEQVDLLRERGLIIEDKEYAINILKQVNYYRLSGYTLTFRKQDVFNPDIRIEDIMQLYYFDSELRSALIYVLDAVEVAFRTHIAYYHSKVYGPLGYKEGHGFENSTYHGYFLKEFAAITGSDKKGNDVFVKHYREDYANKFPIWVAVELISFGALSKLYNNLEYPIRKVIAQEYYRIPADYIQNWLRALVIIRNICAHRGRLYNRPIANKPKLSKQDNQLGIRNDRVFIYIFILKKIVIDKQIWDTFIKQLESSIVKYPFVKLEYLGFPINWRELLTRE